MSLIAAETFHRRPAKAGREIRAAMGSSARRCRGRNHGAQAASAPDALATWVAIASIKPGERQS
jgi:hypothetical protein